MKNLQRVGRAKVNNEIICEVVNQLKIEFAKESTGHDWFHIERVWKMSKLIAAKEGGDLFVIELAALLHDIADHKFVDNADAVAETRIRKMLPNLNEEIIQKVIHIVHCCSFKGNVEKNKMDVLEGLIVQDADRLDAIGAIGIARAFAFGGKFGRLLYHPDIKPATFASEQEYRSNQTHTVNHFYEKLLLLKNMMNTATGKKIAENRHVFMEQFLEQFYSEWNVQEEH